MFTCASLVRIKTLIPEIPTLLLTCQHDVITTRFTCIKVLTRIKAFYKYRFVKFSGVNIRISPSGSLWYICLGRV